MSLRYLGKCAICNGNMYEEDPKSKYMFLGFVYQGKIKRYFHLSCLDSIKRGNSNVKKEQI